MLDNRWATYLYNICLGLNVLLLFLVFFGTAIKVPVFLQVGGRTHPLLLHFPIVLICLSAIWEATKNQRNLNIHHGLGDILLGFSAITCALTALMGLFLAQEGGYDPNLIEWHQWSGVVLS